ncbi:response regulator transcription factor [Streptomyces sp. NPDC001404]|uniref:helix-turn-helix transcriptional regulator n=1 Tax=Streptomyces sp. NPDC001404 TaxID=3364571 RepID=UPI0036BF4516
MTLRQPRPLADRSQAVALCSGLISTGDVRLPTPPRKAARMPRKPAVRIACVLARTAARHRMPLTAAQIRVLACVTADELTRKVHPLPVPEPHRYAVPVPGGFLTAGQLEVLRLAANGRSNEQIAASTHRSLHSVKTRMRLILKRLGAADRTQAVAVAMARGILDPADIDLPEGLPRSKPGRKPQAGAA